MITYIVLGIFLLKEMSRLPGSSSLKRKRPDLTDGEDVVYKLIHSKENMGIWIADIKRETKMSDNMVKKCIKSLQDKNLVKEVVNIQSRGKKHYMAVDFDPSKELTGGDWYTDGKFDTDFINAAKDVFLKYVFKQKVATCDGVLEWTRKNAVFSVDVTAQQVEEILRALVLDDEIIEVESTGKEEFASVPKGKICYKSKGGVRGEKKAGAMASIPCGVCPRIIKCAPDADGFISPRTCDYFEKWLDF